MTAALLVIVAAAALVAFSNGQNDVAKGVSTLVGGGVADYRPALRWGALWSTLGALTGGIAATAMIGTFGKGALAPGTAASPAMAIAALAAAGAWVALATWRAWPVSTTHALLGGVVGAALSARGIDGVAWHGVVHKMVGPLLLSPVLAAALAAALAVLLRPMARAEGERPSSTIDALHWLTSGAASFARGMNDAPKIAALGLAAGAMTPGSPGRLTWFAVVGGAMLAGSLTSGRRVARVLAERLTSLDASRAFAANLITAALVGAGARYGLPMSTTHVSTGAIVGVGAARPSAGDAPRVQWRLLGALVTAWLITAPAAALAAAALTAALAG